MGLVSGHHRRAKDSLTITARYPSVETHRLDTRLNLEPFLKLPEEHGGFVQILYLTGRHGDAGGEDTLDPETGVHLPESEERTEQKPRSHQQDQCHCYLQHHQAIPHMLGFLAAGPPAGATCRDGVARAGCSVADDGEEGEKKAGSKGESGCDNEHSGIHPNFGRTRQFSRDKMERDAKGPGSDDQPSKPPIPARSKLSLRKSRTTSPTRSSFRGRLADLISTSARNPAPPDSG